MPSRTAPRRSTTERGLGWAHQQAVAALKRGHHDGTPCWWCAQPMHLDGARNWDGRVLQGDHSRARALGGTITDRLLHGTCNAQRGDGSRDHERPALTGAAFDEQPADDRTQWCVMAGW